MQKKIITIELLQKQVTEVHLEALLDTLDRLHEAASTGSLSEVSPMTPEQMVGWLEDIVFTAQEAITELCREASLADTADSPPVSIHPPLRVYRRSG